MDLTIRITFSKHALLVPQVLMRTQYLRVSTGQNLPLSLPVEQSTGVASAGRYLVDQVDMSVVLWTKFEKWRPCMLTEDSMAAKHKIRL